MIQGRADGSSPPVLHRRTWKDPSGSGSAVKRAASAVPEGQAAGPTLTALERTLRRSEPTGFVRPEDLRRQFWLALKTAHRVTENPRQAFCRRVPRKVWREDGSVETSLIVVEMRADRQRDRASFSGLFHCGYWTCPLCGPKIAAERAADIA